MRDADGVHAEAADLDGLPRREQAQVGLDAALLEAAADEPERQRAPEHGHRRGLQREGERADVVLMAVGEDDPADAVAALGQVAEVGHDRVDAGQLGRREQRARVDEQALVLALEEEGIQAELAQPAERDETE